MGSEVIDRIVDALNAIQYEISSFHGLIAVCLQELTEKKEETSNESH